MKCDIFPLMIFSMKMDCMSYMASEIELFQKKVVSSMDNKFDVFHIDLKVVINVIENLVFIRIIFLHVKTY